jgi:hypothetical protein
MSSTADQMTIFERFEAIEEIKLLKARRDRFVDTKDWDALESPDVVADVDIRRTHLPSAGRCAPGGP